MVTYKYILRRDEFILYCIILHLSTSCKKKKMQIKILMCSILKFEHNQLQTNAPLESRHFGPERPLDLFYLNVRVSHNIDISEKSTFERATMNGSLLAAQLTI